MFNEDLDVFFDDDGFAVQAEYNGTTIKVIEDKATGEALGMATEDNMIRCKTSDISGIKQGDAIQVNGKQFTVAQAPNHDGQGVTTLELRKAR